MTNTSQVTKSVHAVPIIAAAVLVAIFGLGYFMVGFDQGQLFSIIEGQGAYTQMGGTNGYLHEFTHDMRHASGFPCH
ncbi:MAG: CbtB domain-containing protein [Nitrosotalea sp.]